MLPKKPQPMQPGSHQAVKARSPAPVRKAIATTIASFFLFLLLLPLKGAANPVLGVVHSSGNETEWNNITARLQSSGIGYQPIDLQKIKSPADLAGITILFLANVESLTAEQVKVLEVWVQQGGRLIASGPVGRSSPALVRQSLRSLLGAYWAFPLTSPNAPQPRYRCKDLACNNSTNWVPGEATNSTVSGGVLIPAGLNSQTAATWKQSAGSSAVIASDRAIYLGWRWGTGEAADLDQAWLRAAISRHESTPSTGAIATGHQNHSPRVAPGSSPVPASQLQRRSPTPEPSDRLSTRFSPPPSLSTPVPATFTDPADQSAPAGLEVQGGSQPINSTEAYLMRQELTNLLGRFESALIAANSANTPVNLQAANRSELVATNSNLGGTVAHRPPVLPGATTGGLGNQGASAPTAIAQARQVLQQFDQLLSDRNYAAARQQWLQARQLLWQNYPTDGPRAGAEIRAVWLDRGTIVRAGSEQGLAAVFDRLAQAGINTVFFETVNAGYPIYPSQVAPQQNPLVTGWDPLAAGVKLAHSRGMELHAWIWTFATGNKRHNALLGLANDYPGPVLSAHPDWANIDNQGRRQHVNDGKFYLDPANPEVRSYLLQLIGEIASRYQVDGLQLDYIRYPFQDPNVGFSFGYGKAAREQFKQQTGVDPANLSVGSGDLWRQWTEFKTEKINSFVAEVSQLLRQNYPRTILSVAVFPHPEFQRLYLIQQDWEVWARRGDVDLVVPMTYALDTNRLQRIAQPLTVERSIGPTLIAPAVKLLKLPEIVAIDQIQALRDLPTGGYSIFAVETIGNGLQGFFSRTQGRSPVSAQAMKEPIPYRQPLAAAAFRFLMLKQEWSFLLANSQLSLLDSDLQSLREQASELAQVLSELAAHPSSEKLGNAKRLLAAFQSQFPNWMRMQVSINGYQVQAWQNRLASLDMLLRYGERVELNRR